MNFIGRNSYERKILGLIISSYTLIILVDFLYYFTHPEYKTLFYIKLFIIFIVSKIIQIFFVNFYITLKESKIFAILQSILIFIFYQLNIEIGIYLFFIPIFYLLFICKLNKNFSEDEYNQIRGIVDFKKIKSDFELEEYKNKYCTLTEWLCEIEAKNSKGIIYYGHLVYKKIDYEKYGYYFTISHYDYMRDRDICFSCEINPYEIHYAEYIPYGIKIKFNLKQYEDKINFRYFFPECNFLEGTIGVIKCEKNILDLNLRFVGEKQTIPKFIKDCYPEIAEKPLFM